MANKFIIYAKAVLEQVGMPLTYMEIWEQGKKLV